MVDNFQKAYLEEWLRVGDQRWYIVQKTKIVPSSKNNLWNQFQHRDQWSSLMLLPGPKRTASFWRERRHHCFHQNVGAIFHPKQLSPFLERLELPFPSGEILWGYEDVSSGQDRYTTWVKTDRDVTSERHMVDVEKGRRRLS